MIETTDFSKSEQYTLSIRLSTDGFSFSVFNPLSKEQLPVLNYPTIGTLSLTANLKNAFKDVEWLGYKYRRVNILLANKRFTFIPLDFFEDEQAETVFYHNHPTRENETVLYNILYKNNIVVLFGIDKSCYHFLREQFPECKFYSQASPVIDFLAIKSRLGNSRKMYAYLHKHSMEVYCFERGRLLLANSYPCKGTTDRVYYLLYIWKQLGFEQERDELHLTGTLNDKSELLPQLHTFIQQVFVLNPAENLDIQAIITCE
ncbi:MAG: DUF3822 family protein [Bacteroides sp.]|nr:DUF3822 family protein [Bacteroides sp.]